MFKHRGFPEYVPGTDHKVTIRRAAKDGPTPLKPRERFADRRAEARRADAFFLSLLIDRYGGEPFERGNLDAGRLNWLLGREVVWADEPEPESYEALLRVDMDAVAQSFPQLVEGRR